MAAAFKGIILGFLNVLVISIGISVTARSPEAFVLVAMIGGAPGLVLGLVLGAVAGWTDTQPVALRVTVLMVPALLLVVVLGQMFELSELVYLAAIPTAVAALVLERWTRFVAPAPVPLAQVRA